MLSHVESAFCKLSVKDGKSLGNGLYHSPIKFRHCDSIAEKMMKALVGMMIAYDPEARPTTGEVLQQLQSIAGLWYTLCMYLKCVSHG